jgi:hypothetical protein
MAGPPRLPGGWRLASGVRRPGQPVRIPGFWPLL